MDIYILHEGEQRGPYTEDSARVELNEGRVLRDDAAWRPGMENWVPLSQLLDPPAPGAPNTGEAAGPLPVSDADREPATERQKAFLAYIGQEIAPDLTRDAAARLVDATMENPRDPARLGRWNEERLHLHPELFAAEIQARKENRAQHFLDLCHTDGAALFEKVTKAHCQVLVGHLDVHTPGWDADERHAASKHFFPALAEKFPQLLTETGREKLALHEKGRTPGKREAVATAGKKSAPLSSPTARTLSALLRGFALGLGILAALWIGREMLGRKTAPVQVHAGPRHPVESSPAPTADLSPTTPAPVSSASAPDAAAPKPNADAPASSGEPAKVESAPAPAGPDGDLPTKAAGGNVEPTAALIVPSAARSTVILTRPAPVKLAYGKVSVPPGTPVTILQRNGSTLTVRAIDKVFDVPVSSTDLGTDPVAAAAPPPQ